MRAFLLSSLVFLATGGALYAGLARLSDEVSPVFAVQRRRGELLEARLDEVEVLAIGNSTGHAIHFEPLESVGFHLWSGGQDLFETEALLRSVVDRAPSLHTVLIAIGPSSFTMDNALGTRTDRSRLRRNVYATRPAMGTIDGDHTNRMAVRFGRVAREDHWLGLYEHLFGEVDGVVRHESPQDRMDPDGFLHRNYPPPLTKEIVREQVRAETLAQRELQEDMLAADAALPERAYRALARTVRLARSHDLHVILFQAPVLRQYQRQLAKGSFAELDALFRRLEREEDVVVHDFLDDPIGNRPKLFFDVGHLRRSGARQFTRQRLYPLLRARGDA